METKFQNNNMLNYVKYLSSLMDLQKRWFHMVQPILSLRFFPPFGNFISEFILISNKYVYKAKSTQDCTKVCLPDLSIHQKYNEHLNAEHFARH